MPVVEADLERGRSASVRRAWLEAFESLSRADRVVGLGAHDLEALATAAYMLGREDDYLRHLERAHRLYREAGSAPRAVRCAFWIGLSFLLRGEMSRATGWFGRARRLLERDGGDCVERGYLLIARLLRHVDEGEPEAAYAVAAEAAAIGERFGDADLVALVVQEQGHALVRQGRFEAGLQLLDETMVAVIAGELSPIVTGLVYCNTIAFCQSVLEVGRAREWTEALTRWCERQPDMVAHTGLCLVHRAEILQLQGAWGDALVEARRAGQRLAPNQLAAGRARYREGEIQRLRGELAAAEAAYGDASRCGWEPQPGLARLRLARGNRDAAAAAIRRALSEARDPAARAALLPACVDIMLAVGEIGAARGASTELDRLCAGRTGVLDALSAQAAATVALSEGHAQAALDAARHACRAWQQLEAPHEIARVRVLVGLACRALGDDDTAQLELTAAREVFASLGAAPDVTRVDALSSASHEAHGLTVRELEVLRLVAAGRSNREIAAQLVISRHTVARHMQNIFAKLGVSSRTAASAFVFTHDLL
jgi:DNA-binding CsgD family transcriptional regulator